MNDKYKSKIKSLGIEELKTELSDKEATLRKSIIEARKYGYAPTSTSKFHGNIERARKQIAILKTKIREKGVEKNG